MHKMDLHIHRGRESDYRQKIYALAKPLDKERLLRWEFAKAVADGSKIPKGVAKDPFVMDLVSAMGKGPDKETWLELRKKRKFCIPLGVLSGYGPLILDRNVRGVDFLVVASEKTAA